MLSLLLFTRHFLILSSAHLFILNWVSQLLLLALLCASSAKVVIVSYVRQIDCCYYYSSTGCAFVHSVVICRSTITFISLLPWHRSICWISFDASCKHVLMWVNACFPMICWTLYCLHVRAVNSSACLHSITRKCAALVVQSISQCVISCDWFCLFAYTFLFFRMLLTWRMASLWRWNKYLTRKVMQDCVAFIHWTIVELVRFVARPSLRLSAYFGVTAGLLD